MLAAYDMVRKEKAVRHCRPTGEKITCGPAVFLSSNVKRSVGIQEGLVPRAPQDLSPNGEKRGLLSLFQEALQDDSYLSAGGKAARCKSLISHAGKQPLLYCPAHGGNRIG